MLSDSWGDCGHRSAAYSRDVVHGLCPGVLQLGGGGGGITLPSSLSDLCPLPVQPGAQEQRQMQR